MNERTILIFGGTTEGRLLAEFCENERIPVWVSVVSRYGEELLPESSYVRVHQGAMNAAEIVQFLKKQGITLVVDATHPYAVQASEQIGAACRASGIRLVRCLRKEEPTAEQENGIYTVPDALSAAAFLQKTTGTILLTTGSRELPAFTALPGYEERLYVRVLPSSEVLAQCEALGIRGKHLIAMQGPFSEEMNRALLHQTGARWMVTKDSGREGGVDGKLSAAAACGVSVILVKRPEESGSSLAEVKQLLKNTLNTVSEEPSGRILLAGIGTGGLMQMTGEVREAIETSDVILGADRMLQAAKAVCNPTKAAVKKEWIAQYQEDRILERIAKRSPGEKILVLYSGDTGFYSGAAGLSRRLRSEGIPHELLPGISSISCFAARLAVPWEDAALLTAHGRELSAEEVLQRKEKKLFLLTGGENGAGYFLKKLKQAGGGSYQAAVGENLGYPEERIFRGTVETLSGESFGSLSLIYLEKETEGE
ncbi:MAG: precorrin-6A reductase [Clostridiaceae bacterium]|nr:precorrin-6A reductase [Clostridiaceae bacterium]MDD6075096.1 precorrin-6A reductase [Clostridium sp.]